MTPSLSFNSKKWSYDSTNDVYYQIGTYYVATPAAKDYETLGVYVPGKYLTATKNSDGTYSATVNSSGTVGNYKASSAPIVFPVNTPGYAAQKPPSSYRYTDVSAYLKAGFIYVAAGLRGKDSQSSSYTGNAPWGVTDLKSAVRYLRYNADLIPGDKDRMIVFGHSGGGAQGSVMGASGDSALYAPYLKSIGAALTDTNGKTISDAIFGVMAWCPITSLDFANASYEWNMGQFASTGTRASGTWTAAYSKDLSAAFADYTNKLALKDSSGNTLSLAKSSSGSYLSGSYYDYVVAAVNTSLNNFLSDTTFPYTASNSSGGMAGGAPSGAAASGSSMTGSPPTGGTAPTGETAASGASAAESSSATAATGSSSSGTTYKTVADYIAHLNSDSTWVTYDTSTKTAKVTSLEGFIKSQKNALKDVGAFDGTTRGETENMVHGIGTTGLHFAAVSHDVINANETDYVKISGWKSTFAATEYASDFAKTDSVGQTVTTRENMYNPMYYLSSYYKGHKSATTASHWRIRTGITQGDTANTTEVNLALALANYGVASVDFATVWAQGHTMAERTGDATANFINWVKEVAK